MLHRTRSSIGQGRGDLVSPGLIAFTNPSTEGTVKTEYPSAPSDTHIKHRRKHLEKLRREDEEILLILKHILPYLDPWH